MIADLPYYKVVKDDFDNQWETPLEYLHWVRQVLERVDNFLYDNANILLFTSRQYNHQIMSIMDDIGWHERRNIIWARKRSFNNTRGKTLASGYEPISWYSKSDDYTFNNIKIKVDSKRPEYVSGTLKDGITMSDVWNDIPALPWNSKEKVNHPTQKPLKLIKRIVSQFTKEGDEILDFCMGSGTTGVVCKELGRSFTGIEINQSFFNIATDRIGLKI